MSLKDVGIFSRHEPFVFDIGILNLHPSEGTHWNAYINGKVCDSYGCAPPQKLSHFIIKQNGHCLYLEYKMQGLTSIRDSFYASYCLYESYLTKVLGRDFKSVVLSLYYQSFYK